MKLKNIYSAILIITLLTSCKSDFLDEKPIDFLSSSNAYVSYNDFNLAINDMYRLVRTEFFTRDEERPFDYLYSTDLVFDGQASTNRHTNMTATFDPNGILTSTHWTAHYKIISQANTILSRVESSMLTLDEKKLVIAKSKFFRAFSYRNLAYLYGGVPIILEEVTSPKTDFVRASKNDVYNQCITDLNDAIQGLQSINKVMDGEVNIEAAKHLLSEVYLAAGDYKNSISTASEILNSELVTLMRKRFGKKQSDLEGNVYWDLFQPGNQNRSSGNMEALWVIQIETDVPGGSAISTAQAGSYLLERHHAPYFGGFLTNGTNPFLWPTSTEKGGRGIGWAISTNHFSSGIWQSDFYNDIRNSSKNFIRTYISDNPISPFYEKEITVTDPPPGITVPSRVFYAYQAKCTQPGQHPTNLYQNTSNQILKSTAGGTYIDQYMFRLAETFLIRAEAYLKLGNKNLAARDLNEIRGRSNASLISESEVNIDYILDERMRELGIEEKRKLTLMRLGMLYERVKKFNPYYSDVKATYNLWPIPFSEIERNKDAAIEQNPGYN